MPYTVTCTLLDLGGFYPATPPTFTAALVGMAPGLPVSTTFVATGASFTLPAVASPPAVSGAIMVTDPSGPGDIFRSGARGAWPIEPVLLQMLTVPTGPTVALPAFAGTTFAYPALAALVGAPITIAIPAGAQAGLAAGTGFLFQPTAITITSIAFAPLAGTTDTLIATLTGTMAFNSFFIPRTAPFVATLNVQLAPSGNAGVPGEVLVARASNLAFGAGFITPFVNVALSILAPLVSGALSAPITSALNAGIATAAGPAMAAAGAVGFSPAATFNVRRVRAGTTALTLQIVVSELVPRAVPAIPVGNLTVTILPAPVPNVSKAYSVTVKNAATGQPVPGATVTLRNFSGTAAAATTRTFTTGINGVANFTATLKTGRKRIVQGRGNVDFELLSPTLTVSAMGFAPQTIELLPV